MKRQSCRKGDKANVQLLIKAGEIANQVSTLQQDSLAEILSPLASQLWNLY
jgi:hypothetical protein